VKDTNLFAFYHKLSKTTIALRNLLQNWVLQCLIESDFAHFQAKTRMRGSDFLRFFSDINQLGAVKLVRVPQICSVFEAFAVEMKQKVI